MNRGDPEGTSASAADANAPTGAPQPSEAELYWRLHTAKWDRETARREAAAKRKRKAARQAAKKVGRKRRKKVPK